MSTRIEVHRTLLTHPKVRRLVRALGFKYPDGTPQTIGHLCMLWLWCADHAKGGSLDGLDAQDIADAACWTDDPEKFMDALVETGFIDRTPDGDTIHDWQDYSGKIISAKDRDRQRVRQKRQTITPTEEDDPTVDPEWRKVVLAYEKNIGMIPNGIAGEMLVSYTQDLTADVVIKAIEATNEAQPTNGWQYLKSILDKWVDLGINTVEKADAYHTDLRRRIADAKRRKQQATAVNEPPAITGQFY